MWRRRQSCSRQKRSSKGGGRRSRWRDARQSRRCRRRRQSESRGTGEQLTWRRVKAPPHTCHYHREPQDPRRCRCRTHAAAPSGLSVGRVERGSEDSRGRGRGQNESWGGWKEHARCWLQSSMCTAVAHTLHRHSKIHKQLQTKLFQDKISCSIPIRYLP